MDSRYHPCHYSHVIAANADWDVGQLIFDFRVADLPSLIDGVLIYFSNQWHASRYFESVSGDSDSCSTLPVDARDILQRMQIEKRFAFTIDPCAACGFFVENQIKRKSVNVEAVERLIRSSLVENYQRQEMYVSNAIAAMKTGQFELAYATLLTACQHLNSSNPTNHYLLGVCGLAFGDREIIATSKINLEKLSPHWLDLFEARIKGSIPPIGI